MDEQRLGYGEAADAYRTSQFERAMAVLTDIMANSVKYRIGAMLALEQVRGSELLEGGTRALPQQRRAALVDRRAQGNAEGAVRHQP
jgi:hypothetical protein